MIGHQDQPDLPLADDGFKNGLKEILQVWKGFYTRLAFGLALAMIAAMLALALTSTAASRIGVIAGMTAIAGATALRLIGVGRVLSRYLERYYTHDAMFRTLTATRIWFFRHLARQSGHGLGFLRSGEMLSRLVIDIDTLDVIYLCLIVPFCAACATGVVIAGYAGTLSFGLSAVLSGLSVLLLIVIPALSAIGSFKKGGDVLSGQGALRTAALDYATGLREAAIYDGGQALAGKVMHKAACQARFASGQGRRQTFASIFAAISGQAMVAVCLAWLLFHASQGLHAVSGGIILLFIVFAALDVTGGLARTGPLFGKVRRALIRLSPATDNAEVTSSNGRDFDTQFEKIAFERVSFRWQCDRPDVLHDCNLEIHRGSRIAILGPSGAGKSSLVALLLKVVEPSSGQLTLDGRPFSEIDTADLRRHVAWLSQSTHIFADTVRHNLCLTGQDLPDEALWTALSRAGLADAIRALPEQLDSWVGEGGCKLSGGEGRRLVLARILLSDAQIVVLDEATTGLDADAEQAFLDTLNHVMDGRTLILVLHRLTGIEKLDSIWNLGDGQVMVRSAT